MALLADAPDKVYVEELEQIDASVPALATGTALMVSTITSVVEVQVPWPDAVRVRVTVPAVLSAVLGV